MGIAECGARTGSDWPAGVAARWLTEVSKSQQCHRTRGWLGRLAVGVSPVGSGKGYGNRNVPQVRRNQLRLDRADPGQSGRPKRPAPGRLPAGACSASDGATPHAPARRRRGRGAPAHPSISGWRAPRDGKPHCHPPHSRESVTPYAEFNWV